MMSLGLKIIRASLLFLTVMFLLVSDGQKVETKNISNFNEENTVTVPKYLPTATPTRTPNIITATPTLTLEITKTPTPSVISLPTYYTVKQGDTLKKISDFYDIPIAYIAYKNQIQNLDLIYVGQVLYIDNPPDIESELFLENGKVIVIKLSTQTLIAYENGIEAARFDISSGVSDFPTVTGTFYIYAKFEKTRMTAYDYDIPDVPWTMYYYQGYAIHGAPWHNNFGTPMSHGCVNLAVPNAKWIYDWAPYYTIVKVVQ